MKMLNNYTHRLNTKAGNLTSIVLCDDSVTLPAPVPAASGRTAEFATIRMSAFDRLAARLTALDTEHVSGVWRVTKAAAERRARA